MDPSIDVYTSPVSKYPGSDMLVMLPTVYDRYSDNRSIHLASSEDGGPWRWVPGGAVIA